MNGHPGREKTNSLVDIVVSCHFFISNTDFVDYVWYTDAYLSRAS